MYHFHSHPHSSSAFSIAIDGLSQATQPRSTVTAPEARPVAECIVTEQEPKSGRQNVSWRFLKQIQKRIGFLRHSCLHRHAKPT